MSAYALGHGEEAVKSHASRTAQNSAAYLLPHLQPTFNLLDVGCGPATISCSFAEILKEGSVTGVDYSEEIVGKASKLAQEKGLKNCTFKQGDAYKLDFGDESFDVVHCNALLVHLERPLDVVRVSKGDYSSH